MASDRKTARVPDKFRELSDRELNKITKAFGEVVRAQTIEQKERMRTSLRQEIDAARAAFDIRKRAERAAEFMRQQFDATNVKNVTAMQDIVRKEIDATRAVFNAQSKKGA
ncbi:MAG: hypothetical protein HZA20_08670 [Nitrospirae bacterium]|nr:hypothetical protein [Nitrospirota bacterium]